MPEGYHEDTETELSVSLRRRFYDMKEQLREYSEAVLNYVVFLKNVEDAGEVRERGPELPDLGQVETEATDALNTAAYVEETEDPELTERLGPVISWIEDLNGFLEELQDVEGNLWDEYNEFCEPDWELYSRISPETFLERHLDTAEYLLELCAGCLDHMKDAGL